MVAAAVVLALAIGPATATAVLGAENASAVGEATGSSTASPVPEPDGTQSLEGGDGNGTDGDDATGTVADGSDAVETGGSDGNVTDDSGTDGNVTDATGSVLDAVEDDAPAIDETNASLDAETEILAGNVTVVDASVGVDAEGPGAEHIANVSSDHLGGANASPRLAGGQADTDDDTSTPEGQNGSTAPADGDDEAGGAEAGGPDGGLSDPETAGAGLAVGGVLVGGGLLGRRFAEGTAATGGGGSLLSATLTWLRTLGWRVLAILGYQRYDDSDPLEHETRSALYERIQAEPGISLSAVSDAVDAPVSTVRYHLRILAHENLVSSEKRRGKRRFLPRTVDSDRLDTALDEEATAAVLGAIASDPDSVSGLADRLDRDPSTVSHHLQRLDEEGLVERERDGRAVVSRLADDVDPADVFGGTPSPAD